MFVTQTEVQPMDMDNLFLYNDSTFSGLQAYKNSKLANVMFTYELSRQLEGTGVKVNAVDPGNQQPVGLFLSILSDLLSL